MQKLTHEQHKARAMLMGLAYDWRNGTYYRPMGTFRDGSVATWWVVDAQTLKPMTGEQVAHRNKDPDWQVFVIYYGPGNAPRTTPYAEADT